VFKEGSFKEAVREAVKRMDGLLEDGLVIC
jgi:hypothetical protein